MVLGRRFLFLFKPPISNLFSHRLLSSQMSSPQLTRKHLSVHELHENILIKTPIQPLNPKHLRVGVVGMPNVGKSTLINSLVGKSLMATSNRIDTTRESVLALWTEDNIQIEFQDTPGIHNRRKSKKIRGEFQSSFLPGDCMQSSDLVMIVVDLSERRTSRGFLQPEILLHLIQHKHVPTILVLNKVDQLSHKLNVLPLISSLTAGVVDGSPVHSETVKQELEGISLPEIQSDVLNALDAAKTFESATDINLANQTETKLLKQLRHCRGWPHFKEVFVISALRKDMIKNLKIFIQSQAISRPWKYHSDVLTDASPSELVINAVRASMLENLANEVPYLTDIHLSDWEEKNDAIHIRFDLVCHNFRHLRFVNGQSAVIAYGAKKRLTSIFSTKIIVHVLAFSENEYTFYNS